MKRQRAGVILEINQDHGRGASAVVHFHDKVFASPRVRLAIREQVAGCGSAVFHFDVTHDRKDLSQGNSETALQALGAGGLGEGKLRGRMHRAEMISDQWTEGQLQQMGSADGCIPDAKSLVVGEVGGFQHLKIGARAVWGNSGFNLRNACATRLIGWRHP
jgi:hypothetical protein